MHFGFKYKDGYNEDTNEFLPFGSCGGGGLYFSEFDKYFVCYFQNFWGIGENRHRLEFLCAVVTSNS